jgi:hypothetical protein
MALTKVSYSMIAGAPANVVDFGADPTGIVDSSAAIQAAIDAHDEVYLPIGTYLLTAPIRITRAVTVDGDQEVILKAAPTFTGINVTLGGNPFVLSAIFAIFTGNVISTTSGSRIGENGIGVKIGNFTVNCDGNADYGMWIERSVGSHISIDVTDCVHGIHLGPYCWGSVLNNNRIFRCANTAIYLGTGANGVSVLQPEIWGETISTSVGIKSEGNNNGVLISGGYIETCITGIYLVTDSGPHTIVGIDFEVITQHCIRGDNAIGEPRPMGPITVQNCYLDSVDADIYNQGYLFIVSGCRFRTPSTTTGSHFFSATDNTSLFLLEANSYDGASGVPIPENLDGTTRVTSQRINQDSFSIINKKRTDPGGSYVTAYGIYNYSSVDQPNTLSNSEEFQNSRQGGPTEIYASRWQVQVNETETNPGPVIASTAGISVQSLGLAKSFTPITNNSHTLGNASVRWSEVFAISGTINTSDANEKQQIRDLTEAELATAKQLKTLIKAFKWNDAVEKKGDGARIHVGVIAQEVAQAFTDNGLDPEKYGVFCRDVWYTANGEPCLEFAENAERHELLGVRYDQLLAFIIAAL